MARHSRCASKTGRGRSCRPSGSFRRKNAGHANRLAATGRPLERADQTPNSRPRQCSAARNAHPVNAMRTRTQTDPMPRHWIGIGASPPGGHPLAVSVKRDAQISATVPHILSSCIPCLFVRRTLGSRSWLRRCAPVTHRDQGMHTLQRREPLAAFTAPENPLYPTASNPRSQTSRLHNVLASPIGDPAPFGSRCGRNELINMGGIGASVQSILMVLPTHL